MMIEEVILSDVNDSRAEDIKVGLQVYVPFSSDIPNYDKSTYGILLYHQLPDRSMDSNYRLVIENVEGKLMVHIWSTIESLGNDPTHSIEIESVE